MSKDETPDQALRRKMRDPAFQRQHVRDELDRESMHDKRAIYDLVKGEMGDSAAGLLIIHMRLCDYAGGDAAEFKFASKEQEPEFRRRVAARVGK